MKPSRLLYPLVFLLALTAAFVLVHVDPSTAAPALLPASPLGLALTDTAGLPHTLGNTLDSKATAIVLLDTECPISNRLIPTLNELSAVAAKNNVEFFGLISTPDTTRQQAQKHHDEFHIAFPVLFDASGTLARRLHPVRTPQAFLFASTGRLIYSGRIDGSYSAIGKPVNTTPTTDLLDAMNLPSNDRAPRIADPVGCIYEAWKEAPADPKKSPITYDRDIAPILSANCVNCHRDGQVAPFALTNYHDAAKRAQMLAAVTQSRQMPPWKATSGFGSFHDARRLADEDIALLQSWADAGAPEGNPADLPVPRTFSDSGWALGTPDLVVTLPKPVAIPAAGRDIFRYFVLPLHLSGDETLVGFEYHPSNRKVVHHMIAFLDSRGQARKIAQAQGDGTAYDRFGGPGFLPTGSLGGWAPGATPRFLPDGVGRRIAAGSDLVMQTHYHPSGKPEIDQGSVALYFAKKPVSHYAFGLMLRNSHIDIPPGEKKYILTSDLTVPFDCTLFGITPHMHNVGREMKVTATLPQGTTLPLIWIQDWNWNWQDQYQYQHPIRLPKGTVLHLTASYDNSTDNPNNPNSPPKRVRRGEQTTDEMCLCFLNAYADHDLVPDRKKIAMATFFSRQSDPSAIASQSDSDN